MRTVRLVVSGRVQGVGFRAFTVRQADRLGVDGWVRNLEDGRVEALAAGEEQAVEGFIAAVRKGPVLARVTDLAVEEVAGGAVPAGFVQRG